MSSQEEPIGIVSLWSMGRNMGVNHDIDGTKCQVFCSLVKSNMVYFSLIDKANYEIDGVKYEIDGVNLKIDGANHVK